MPSDKARHSSVKLRHILSAFRRTCRSETEGIPPIVDWELEIGPGWPELPIIEAIARASEAVASKALYTSVLSSGLDFARAAWRSGRASAGLSATTGSVGDMLLPRPRFGDEDMVVTVVVAVGGRSLEARDIAAPDVAGSFPVNSSLCIRDLRSSNSSQTVEGAVVETVDSVPSAARGVSGVSDISTVRETRGDEL